MRRQLLISIKILFVFTLITGIIYPLFITLITNLLFKEKANGSLVIMDNKITGSRLIGQHFDSTVYFWPRPSAINYNPLPSGGSNFGPISKKLQEQVIEYRNKFIETNGLPPITRVPSEMVFASASGLDPHISPEAALLQVNRIVKARSFSDKQRKELVQLIDSLTESPQFHLFGQPRINVFILNLQLDRIK